MYALRFVNIPDAGTRYFNTFELADVYGKKAGFQFSITKVS